VSTRGRFIVFEGIEGAGKTTAISIARNMLLLSIPEVVTTREPGGTLLGESIRSLIKASSSEPMDTRAELLLFYAARVQLMTQVILPALERGAWVLADRFELSTFAYQGGGRGLPRRMIEELSLLCLEGVKPDLTVFMDVDPERGLQRVSSRGPKDRIEQESLHFFKQVSDCYRTEIKHYPHVHVIDANQAAEDVELNVLTLFKQQLQSHLDG